MSRVNAKHTGRVSDKLLAEVPARALTFLRAIATRPPIAEVLYQGGYCAEAHAEGMALLTATCDYRHPKTSGSAPSRAQDARAEIHAWVTTHFGRFRIALERLHPEFVHLFPKSDARYPEQSLVAVATLLQELSRDRAGSNAQVMRLLEQRGLDTTMQRHLATLIAEAQRLEKKTAVAPEFDARTSDLLALYAWYRDWAETAHRFVKRKDHLRSLGIAAKREESE